MSVEDVSQLRAVDYEGYRYPQRLVEVSNLQDFEAEIEAVVNGQTTGVVYRNLFDAETYAPAASIYAGLVQVDFDAYPEVVRQAVLASHNNSKMPPEFRIPLGSDYDISCLVGFGSYPTGLHLDYPGIENPTIKGPNFLINHSGEAVVSLIKMPGFIMPNQYQKFTDASGFLTDEARIELGAVEAVLHPGDAVIFTGHEDKSLGITGTLHQVAHTGKGPWIRPLATIH